MKAGLFLLGLLLSGCTLLTPDYKRPTIDAPAWQSPAIPSDQPSEIPLEWWKKFGSAELDQLTADALQNNTDLQASVERIKEAKASAQVVEASLFPTVGGTASYSRTRTDVSGFSQITRSYQAGLSIAYETDLFGGKYLASNSADEAVRGSQLDHEALALVVSAEVAKTYTQLLSTNDRLQIAKKDLENQNQVIKIIQARYDAGKISGLELAQQKTIQANTETTIAGLVQSIDVLRNQLAVYTGQPAQAFVVSGTTLTGFKIPTIAPLQPSTLLDRRPDIQKAESDLIASNFDIGAARAAYFPSFNLAYNPGISATPTGAPAVLTTGLIASMAQTIFDGGAINGTVDRAKAHKAELIDTYRGVVLVAFQEVQDALSATKSADSRLLSLQVAVNESQKAYTIARQQYEQGSIDFQNLLDSERQLLSAQDSFFQAQSDRISASIDLYKALGGGWLVPGQVPPPL